MLYTVITVKSSSFWYKENKVETCVSFDSMVSSYAIKMIYYRKIEHSSHPFVKKSSI